MVVCITMNYTGHSRSQGSFPLKEVWGTKQWGSNISKWGSGPSSSAVETRIEAPMRVGGVWREEGVRKAGCGDGCAAPHWGRVWEGVVPPPEKKSILHLK